MFVRGCLRQHQSVVLLIPSEGAHPHFLVLLCACLMRLACGLPLFHHATSLSSKRRSSLSKRPNISTSQQSMQSFGYSALAASRQTTQPTIRKRLTITP